MLDICHRVKPKLSPPFWFLSYTQQKRRNRSRLLRTHLSVLPLRTRIKPSSSDYQTNRLATMPMRFLQNTNLHRGELIVEPTSICPAIFRVTHVSRKLPSDPAIELAGSYSARSTPGMITGEPVVTTMS